VSRILLSSLAIFAVCQLIHIAWWRVRRPATYAGWVPALTMIFFVAGGALAWWAANRVPVSGAGASMAWAAIMLCHGALALVYIIGYTLVVAHSPSLEILKRLSHAEGGLPRASVALARPDEELTGQRIRNLCDGSMLRNDAASLSLGPRGTLLAGTVLFYRHLVGLPDGEGG
jgi:hypothetical protein